VKAGAGPHRGDPGPGHGADHGPVGPLGRLDVLDEKSRGDRHHVPVVDERQEKGNGGDRKNVANGAPDAGGDDENEKRRRLRQQGERQIHRDPGGLPIPPSDRDLHPQHHSEERHEVRSDQGKEVDEKRRGEVSHPPAFLTALF
jgi:hypothetical protein